MEKLYYQDSYQKEFTARVTGCRKEERFWQITLEATAFYPEGGGQPWDTGSLGEVRVLEVREKDGQILHLCDGPLEEGRTVTGRLDWQRRLEIMQQHTGEHILSGLVHKAFGYHNIGFHLGQQTVQVDFDGPISYQQAMELERQSNEAVWNDLPVLCYVPQSRELEDLSYRSKRKLPWPVRIVEIPGIDRCACCGVHTKTTAQVGLVKILSCIKFHEGTRLELVCGVRAYRYLAQIFEENRAVAQLLSAKMPETFRAVERLNDGLNEEKQRSAALQKQVFDSIAKSYVNQQRAVHFENGLTGGQLRLLAERIAAACGGLAAVFTGSEGGYDYCLAQPGADLREMGRQLNRTLEGRGGGKPEFQQGQVRAKWEDILDFFGKN